MCIEYSASLGKRTLGIVLCGNAGVVDASLMATISKYQTFIDNRFDGIVRWDLFRLHALAAQAAFYSI